MKDNDTLHNPEPGKTVLAHGFYQVRFWLGLVTPPMIVSADMNIDQIMTERFVTVELDDPLSLVKQIFNHCRFHHLLVVNRVKLVGVVSDRDLFEALSPYLGTAAEINRDRQTLNQRVHKIMSRELVTLTASATVRDAVDVFNTDRISCIPIIDESGKPIGIVSWRDVLKVL